MNAPARHWRPSRGTATALWLVLLMALTLALGKAPWRYRVVAETVFQNLDFSQGGRGWASSGQGIQLYPGTPPVLALNARGIGQHVIISRLLPRGARNLQWLRIGADLSSRDLLAGHKTWQRGRLILLSLDAGNKRIWYWPQQVAALDGNRPWQHYQSEIPLNPGAAQTWLLAYVSAASGKLLLKNLKVEGVTETMIYRGVRLLLIGAWVLTGIWIAAAVLPLLRSGFPAVFALGYAVALFAGGLTPQPQLRDTLNSGRQEISQALTAAAALLPRQAPPANTPGTPTITSAETPDKQRQAAVAAAPATPVTAARHAARNAGLTSQLRIAGSDKRLHLIAFAGLSLILLLVFRSLPRRRLLIAAVLLGAAIESLQSLSITREPEWVDLGYDTAGIMLGAAAALLLLAWTSAKSPKP